MTRAALRVDAARNHRRILSAAGRAFEEIGPGVSLEEIAQRAGVGVATVYRRFGSRDGLIRAVVAEAFRAAVSTVGETDDPWADLAAMLGATLDAFAGHRVALGLARGLFDVDTVQAYLRVLDRPFRRAIAARVVRPELRADDLAAVLVMVLAAGHGTGGGARRRRYLALVLDGLRPGRPPLPPAPGN